MNLLYIILLLRFLYYNPFISKALRYGPCVTMGSYSSTCDKHTNHTCLYSCIIRKASLPFGW